MAKKLFKIKKKKPSLNVMVSVFEDLQSFANLNYWLHPEFENMEQYLNEYLKIKFPKFDWYICARYKMIKINP